MILTTKIHNRTVAYSGSLEHQNIILILGRNNNNKASTPLDIVSKFFVDSDNFTLIWFGDYNYTYDHFRDKIKPFIPELLIVKTRGFRALLNKQLKRLKRLIRDAFDVNVRYRHTIRHLDLCSHVLLWDKNSPVASLLDSVRNAEKVRQFTKALSNHSLFIIGFSAGGRIASLVANEPNVKKLIGFGYPFHNPNESADISRTLHLKTLAKPFLIIQGTQDEYGGDNLSTTYQLSDKVILHYVDTDHEYADLSDEEWKIILEKIDTFLHE